MELLNKFNLGKLLNGFNIFDGEKLGKLLFLVTVCVIVIIGFNRITAPKPAPQSNVTTSAPVTVQNCNCDPKTISEFKKAGKNESFFKLWFIRIG